MRYTRLKKFKKAKNCKIKKGSNQTFSAVCHHQGCHFFSLVYEIHFIERTVWLQFSSTENQIYFGNYKALIINNLPFPNIFLWHKLFKHSCDQKGYHKIRLDTSLKIHDVKSHFNFFLMLKRVGRKRIRTQVVDLPSENHIHWATDTQLPKNLLAINPNLSIKANRKQP